MSDLRVYVINLDRAPDRLAAVDKQLRSLGLAYERIPAFDSADVTPDTMRAITAPRLGRVFRRMPGFHRTETFGPTMYWPEVGRYFVAGEIACYLSHNRALQTFLASGANRALIFEDDVEIDGDIAEVLDAIGRLPPRARLVKLEGIQASHEAHYRLASAGARDIVMMLKPATGAAAYCINRAGAGEIFSQSMPVREPFDAFLRQYWLHGVEVLETRPFPVRQRMLGTTIHGRDEQQRAVLPPPYGALRGVCLPMLKLARLVRRGLYLAKSPYRLSWPRRAPSPKAPSAGSRPAL